MPIQSFVFDWARYVSEIKFWYSKSSTFRGWFLNQFHSVSKIRIWHILKVIWMKISVSISELEFFYPVFNENDSFLGCNTFLALEKLHFWIYRRIWFIASNFEEYFVIRMKGYQWCKNSDNQIISMYIQNHFCVS